MGLKYCMDCAHYLVSVHDDPCRTCFKSKNRPWFFPREKITIYLFNGEEYRKLTQVTKGRVLGSLVIQLGLPSTTKFRVNKISEPLTYHLQDGDRISIVK
jgi:hypothetical protein